jgi:hypothetical protein
MKSLIQLIRFSILTIVLLTLPACGLRVIEGSGQIETESRPVSGFDAVNFSGSGELVITQGNTEALTVEADDNLLPYIKTEVRNGELFIGFDREDGDAFYRPSQPVRFNLAVKDLRRAALSGSGSISMGELNTDRLTLEVSGSGNVRIDQLQAPEMTFNLSGSGQADLSGQVASQQIDISGSGGYRAGDLESERAALQTSGSASAVLWVNDSLDVEISGSGSVSYYGSPTINSNVSGSGSLTSLGDK